MSGLRSSGSARLEPVKLGLALSGELLAAVLAAEMAVRWLPGPWLRIPAVLLILLWTGAHARGLPGRKGEERSPWLRQGQVRDALLLLIAVLAALAGRPDLWALAGFAVLLVGHLAALPTGRRLVLLAAGIAAGAALLVAGALAIPAVRGAIERFALDVFLALGWLLGDPVLLLVSLLSGLAGGAAGRPPAPPQLDRLRGGARPESGWLQGMAGSVALFVVAAGVLFLLGLGAWLLLQRMQGLRSSLGRAEAGAAVRVVRSGLEGDAARGRARPGPAPTRLRRAYQRLDRAFRTSGLGRGTGETPLRFAERPLPLAAAERQAFGELTRRYVGHRYGPEPDATASQLQGVPRLLREVRRLGQARRRLPRGETMQQGRGEIPET